MPILIRNAQVYAPESRGVNNVLIEGGRIMSVSSGAAGSLKLSLLGLGALASVMAATALILIATSLAESYVDKRVTSVFSRITAIILATLSMQYIIDR